jgi:hypothetical protein
VAEGWFAKPRETFRIVSRSPIFSTWLGFPTVARPHRTVFAYPFSQVPVGNSVAILEPFA